MRNKDKTKIVSRGIENRLVETIFQQSDDTIPAATLIYFNF